MKKSNFKFDPMDGLVDVYVSGAKIRNSHNGSLGVIAMPLDPRYAPYVSVEPHDERIGIDAVIDDSGGLQRFIRPEPVNPKPDLPAELR